MMKKAKREKLERMLTEGYGLSQIARELNISRTTVWRYQKEQEEKEYEAYVQKMQQKGEQQHVQDTTYGLRLPPDYKSNDEEGPEDTRTWREKQIDEIKELEEHGLLWRHGRHGWKVY